MSEPSPELVLQSGTLTRITDAVRSVRGNALSVYAICVCCRICRYDVDRWRDGWKRPKSCTYCAKLRRRPFTESAYTVRQPSDITPYWR